MDYSFDSFRNKNLSQWESAIRKIFRDGVPSKCKWNNVEDIILTLYKISSHESLSHAFLPSGGGMDLSWIDKSNEEGCIELHFGVSVYIVKPFLLSFHSLGPENFEWAYFRLETGNLEPSGVYDQLMYDMEELIEIGPGKYINFSYWDRDFMGYDEDGNEMPFPKGTRTVTRQLKGAFVIFAKTSVYNQISGTYDARHNKVTNEEFEKYIAKMAEDYRKIKSK